MSTLPRSCITCLITTLDYPSSPILSGLVSNSIDSRSGNRSSVFLVLITFGGGAKEYIRVPPNYQHLCV
jgi:hypothetical protein